MLYSSNSLEYGWGWLLPTLEHVTTSEADLELVTSDYFYGSSPTTGVFVIEINTDGIDEDPEEFTLSFNLSNNGTPSGIFDDGVTVLPEPLTFVIVDSRDEDDDGVEDQWEIGYFGAIERDLGLNYDGDGYSDYEEYVYDTWPHQAHSHPYSREVEVNGHGDTEVFPVSQLYDYGDEVRLQATNTEEAYEFYYWDGLPAGAARYQTTTDPVLVGHIESTTDLKVVTGVFLESRTYLIGSSLSVELGGSTLIWRNGPNTTEAPFLPNYEMGTDDWKCLTTTGGGEIVTRVRGPGFFALDWMLDKPFNDGRIQLLVDGVLVAEKAPGGWSTEEIEIPAGDHDIAIRVPSLNQFWEPVAAVDYVTYWSNDGGTGLPPTDLADNGSTGHSRIVNLAVRSIAGTGAETLNVGVVVAGDGNKPLVFRAIGPRLNDFGVSGTLADPAIEIRSNDTVVASNEDWPAILQDTFTALGAFGLETRSADAALLTFQTAGVYPAVVDSKGEEGIVLVEVFDADNVGEGSAQLVNVSARSRVGTGANVLIAGFSIGGNTNKNILVRGIGASLADFGVSNALEDAVLEIHRLVPDSDPILVASNDNWDFDPSATAAAATLGAFELSSGTDSVLLLDLDPGSYTATLSGAGGTVGVGLVEVYDAD